MRSNEERVWAGSETSLQAATEAEQALATRLAAGTQPDEERDAPRLLAADDGRPQSTSSPLMRLGKPAVDNMWDYDRQPIVKQVAGAFAHHG